MIPTEKPAPFTMSRPCPKCGGTDGTITKVGPQNVVRCAGPDCGARFVYNAPKSETGEEVRHVRTREPIDPSTRARILERDGWRCMACGSVATSDVLLHVGHMLSVEDAERLRADGLDVCPADLAHDANLISLCEACNLGQSGRSVMLRIAYFILRAHVERDEGKR